MESKLVPISQFKTQEHSASDALIRQWLFRFGVEHKEDVAPRLPLWLERFGGMRPEVLEPLFRKALDTCKFFPKVSDILELVEHTKGAADEEAAARKWEQVREQIRLHYSPDLPWKGPRIHERTRRAINAAGGMAYLSECVGTDLVFARQRFIESYLRWDELKQDEYLLPEGELKKILAGVAQSKALPSSSPSFAEKAKYLQGEAAQA